MATVTTPATRLLTADEFCDFVHRPENRGRFFELERGVIVEMPPPNLPHGVVCAIIARILGNFTDAKKRGYVTSNDTGVVLETDPDTVRGIDVLLFDEIAKYADLEPKYARHMPTLAVEVLSPDARPGKTMRRVSQFLRQGIPLVWVVDPDSRDVTVYRPGREAYVLGLEDELSGEDVLPDFRCRVHDFFRLPGE